MTETALYTSPPSVMSLGAEYRIYADRLELDTRLFGLITLPFAQLQRFRLRPPIAIFDLFRRGHGLKSTHRSAKLDMADLTPHIALERATGLFRQLRITPGDPEAFLQALQGAYQAWQAA